MVRRYKFVRYEELRLDFGMKQGEIADMLNVKRNTYSKWENCINDMPLEKCNELVNIYNTSFDYLLGQSNINDNSLQYQKEMNLKLLPKKLLELREKHKFTQQYLSDKLGFHQRTYCNYEKGTRRITTFKLLVIAQFYNVSVDYLVGRSLESKIYIKN